MRLLPPPGPERRRTLVLLAILAALVAWVYWPAGVPDGAPMAAAPVGPAPTAGAPAGPGQNGPGLWPAPVRIDALEREARALDVGRNLFRYGARPAPPPPPPSPVDPAPPPLPPPPPAGPPPVPLRLTGRFETPDGRVIVTLKHADTGALFHAVEGDIVDGRYRLVKVGNQTVVVSRLDGTGQRTIALGGG